MPVSYPPPVTKGKKTRPRIALLGTGNRSRPADVVFEISATTPPAKGATTIALAASVTTTAKTGQYVQWVDGNGKLYIAQLNADYTTGTSMTVKALPEAIPSGSKAEFPVEFNLRTAADFDDSTDVDTVNTYDHPINGDSTPGATTLTLTTGGLYSFYDAGSRTCIYAKENNLEVWVERELDIPSDAFSKGEVRGGAALVTSAPSAAPNESSVTQDFTFQINGTPYRADPVPV